jgi:hypothetical protein
MNTIWKNLSSHITIRKSSRSVLPPNFSVYWGKYWKVFDIEKNQKKDVKTRLLGGGLMLFIFRI